MGTLMADPPRAVVRLHRLHLVEQAAEWAPEIDGHTVRFTEAEAARLGFMFWRVFERGDGTETGQRVIVTWHKELPE